MHHSLFEERVSIFIGLNAILQFVGDVFLEAMGLIPPRINHLALTFLNAFISFKTLSAIQKDKFRFLHEDCQVFWVLELLLVIGDVYYSAKDEWGREFISIRLIFVAFSTFNWLFVTWIIVKYKLYHITYQGTHDEENTSFIHENDNGSDKEETPEPKSHQMDLTPICQDPDIDDTALTKLHRIKAHENGHEDTHDTHNMKDYHPNGNEFAESVEDSLSNKNKSGNGNGNANGYHDDHGIDSHHLTVNHPIHHHHVHHDEDDHHDDHIHDTGSPVGHGGREETHTLHTHHSHHTHNSHRTEMSHTHTFDTMKHPTVNHSFTWTHSEVP